MMTDDKLKKEETATEATVDPGTPPDDGEEMLYEEPPRMTGRDIAGVVMALLALAVIGYTGYLWLTPGKSVGDLLAFGGGGTQADSADSTPAQAGTEVAATEIRCGECGMFADRSLSWVYASFADGSDGNFDSWGCFFSFIATSGNTPVELQVVDYSAGLENPEWLDARSASFLYGTERVAGSMPPFVAAFANPDEALKARGSMGGELLDFAGLSANWPDAAHNMSDMSGNAAAPVTAGGEHGMQDMADHSEPDRSMEVSEHGEEPATEQDEAAATQIDAVADQPHLHDHELNCVYCGMFADRSVSHVVGYWHDGTHTHHDCWDCLFKHGAENGLELKSALAKTYNSSLENPVWVAADSAAYLFKTKPLKGSMPPFTAAFATETDAIAAQAELGGELVFFDELSANWE